MRISADNAIALVVDYQTKLVPAMSDIDSLIHNSSILLKGLAVLGIPAIITQQYTRGLGETVPEILEAAGDALLNDAGTVTAEFAKQFAESEFEKYRVIQDRLFSSDFDRFDGDRFLPLDFLPEV